MRLLSTKCRSSLSVVQFLLCSVGGLHSAKFDALKRFHNV